MNSGPISRYMAPDVIAGMVVIAVCGFFLWRTEGLPAGAALFPRIVLWGTVGLGMLLSTQGAIRVARTGEKPRFFKHVGRFFAVILIAFAFIVAIDFVGFYTSTALMIPLVAAGFGYRKAKGLILVTTIFVSGMLLIFEVLMRRHFPAEFFLG